MKRFALRNKTDKHFFDEKNGQPRLFNRRCDAANAAKRFHRWTPGYNWRDAWELVEYEVKLFELGRKAPRPDWTNYFLGLAHCVAMRSHDIHTKVGCVIVDTASNHILGTGYNGFPKGMADESLPLTRPQKYQWMIHAEANALANCVLRPEGAFGYLTHEPCLRCAQQMHQHGIAEVIYVKTYNTMTDTERIERDKLSLRVTKCEDSLDLFWLNEVVLNL